MKPILLAILLPALINGEDLSGLSVVEVNKKITFIIYSTKAILCYPVSMRNRSLAVQKWGSVDGHRLKRQAMNWKAWPQVLWVDGVNYLLRRFCLCSNQDCIQRRS
ncbi:hypothetical protein OSTOST_25732 [Ostertagia ostertagi]